MINAGIFLIGLSFGITTLADITYPPTPRGRTVDAFKGESGDVAVADPYRWLEQKQTKDDKTEWSDQVTKWLASQSKLTGKYLESIDSVPRIKKLIKEFTGLTTYGNPKSAEDNQVYTKKTPDLLHPIIYLKQKDEKEKMLIDINKLSKDGSISLASYEISPNGLYLIYGLREGGSDWTKFVTLDLKTNEHLSEEIHWSKYFSVAWHPDSTGFYYGRFPEVDDLLSAETKNHMVYFHALRTPQEKDQLIYKDEKNQGRIYGFHVNNEGRQFILSVYDYTSDKTYGKNMVWIKSCDDHDKPFQKIIDKFTASYEYVGTRMEFLHFLSNEGANLGKIVAINPKTMASETIVKQRDNALTSAILVGEHLTLQYLVDVAAKLEVINLSSNYVTNIELPSIGSVKNLAKGPNPQSISFNFQSFIHPPQNFTSNLLKYGSDPAPMFPKDKELDFKNYQVHQYFYPSFDGQDIPIFVINRKDQPLDRSQKVLLYGYGGFNISITPSFKEGWAGWLASGGTLAIANLRGGGEYGETWHKAGALLKKQNVFDDFISAALFLIQEGFTDASRIAISGRSNGGLLVGATVQQRPDLFAAALADVGVMDMLRYHKFSGGKYWIGEYGNVNKPKDFENLFSYSPVHNAKLGAEYPAVLVSTGEYDNRVDPSHSFKFAAAMQYAQGAKDPILLQVHKNSGHGAGRSEAQIVQEYAEKFAFILEHMD